MPAKSSRSASADAIFFTALENGHAVQAACRMANYARRCVYRWRGSDPAFAGRWTMALQLAGDLLEEEADRRGRDGYDVPVFYRGEACGTKRMYSHALLLARLKAVRPADYRDRAAPPPPAEMRPVQVVVRDYMLEQIAKRLYRGEAVELANLTPRLQQLFAPTGTASKTQ